MRATYLHHIQCVRDTSQDHRGAIQTKTQEDLKLAGNGQLDAVKRRQPVICQSAKQDRAGAETKQTKTRFCTPLNSDPVPNSAQIMLPLYLGRLSLCFLPCCGNELTPGPSAGTAPEPSSQHCPPCKQDSKMTRLKEEPINGLQCDTVNPL